MENDQTAIVFSAAPRDVLGYIDGNGDVFFSANSIARFVGFVNCENGEEQVDWELLNSSLKRFGFKDDFQDSFLTEHQVRCLLLTLNSELRKAKESVFDNEIASVFNKAWARKFVIDSNFAISALKRYATTLDKKNSQRNQLFFGDLFPRLKETSSDNPELKCVYALKMSNNTVKIGCTGNFKKRAQTISNSSGLDILNWCHSKYVPSAQAYALEKTCHDFFADARTKGEFFNIDFEKAFEKLEQHLEIEESMHI